MPPIDFSAEAIETKFSELARDPLYCRTYCGKRVLFVAVCGPEYQGHYLAARIPGFLDPNARTLEVPPGGSGGPRKMFGGLDVFPTEPAKELSEASYFLYPEDDLSEEQASLFVKAVIGHPQIKTALIITNSPDILACAMAAARFEINACDNPGEPDGPVSTV